MAEGVYDIKDYWKKKLEETEVWSYTVHQTSELSKLYNRTKEKSGCVASDVWECPCWPPSSTKSAYNGHVSIRNGPWGNARRWCGLINHVLFNIMCTTGAEMAPGWRKGGGSVMAWEAIGSEIHVHATLACITFLSIAAEQEDPKNNSSIG